MAASISAWLISKRWRMDWDARRRTYSSRFLAMHCRWLTGSMMLRAFTRGVVAMAKKSKKKPKGKAPDLHKIMGKMNEADALLQCALRSLKQRCSPTDAGAER